METPKAANTVTLHLVRRLYENAKRMGDSGVWLSVEEVAALLNCCGITTPEKFGGKFPRAKRAPAALPIPNGDN